MTRRISIAHPPFLQPVTPPISATPLFLRRPFHWLRFLVRLVGDDVDVEC